MKVSLVYDENNPKYSLLSSIFKIIESREAKQELTRNRIKPIKAAISAIKVKFMSMFFKLDVKYCVNELNNSLELRKRFGIFNPLNYDGLSKFISMLNSEQILEFVIKLINKQFPPAIRGRRTVIIDATPIMLDINLNKKFRTDEDLEKNNFAIGYSKTHGSYIGGKLTLALDLHTGQPLAMLIHKGTYHDSKIFLEMVEKLKKRRIISDRDIIMADKGYVSYDNYEIALMKYKIIPIIFPRENMRISKILSCFNYPLEVFKNDKKLKKLLKDLVATFKVYMEHWKFFKDIRGTIEHFFKLMKKGVGHGKYHVYTYESMSKEAYLNVLLTGLCISTVSFDLRTIQRLSEM